MKILIQVLVSLLVGGVAALATKQQPIVGQGQRVNKLTLADHAAYTVHLHSSNENDWCPDTADRFTGYFETPNGFFFFYFFESRSEPEKDPLILWINGGPGCSSALGLFMELGPCRVDPGGNSSSFNPYSWNTKANLMFLDQPVDVGFSYAKPGGKVSDSEQAAIEVDIFFQILFYNLPKYSKAPLHIFGESYAGHYIPAIGRKIYRENLAAPQKNPNRIHVNLESLGIGNGWVRPLIQFDYFAEFLVDKKYGPLISKSRYDSLKEKYPLCKALSTQCERRPSRYTCIPADSYCEVAFGLPSEVKRNGFDVRQPCDPDSGKECYSIMEDIDSYLNLPWVQSALGVDREYLGCSSGVGDWFYWTGDGGIRYDTAVAEVLEGGVKVLIYAGDADFVCNWNGIEAWLHEMEWSGQQGYRDAPKTAFMVADVESGYFKTHSNLTWLVMFDSGHMVPYDKPIESLQMLMDWIA
ncbi:Alpha/Beta hydrolase protein [Chytriomyces cf. hyalinus JEL632]|nr:Alpha/Beta hydrolase protein [Chytriomyces cf. hyalinus JEL632]